VTEVPKTGSLFQHQILVDLVELVEEDDLMTWITDDSGTRWVDVPQPKRRKPGRILRFANIKVGDQLVLKPKANWYLGLPIHSIVTDLWDDPVDGQHDPIKGKFVGLRQIDGDGELRHRKSKIKLRGLASQGYEYAEIDFIAQRKAAVAGVQDGSVIGIGAGERIRKRPKIAGL